MSAPEIDKRYLVQLRRELTRSQAQLGRAERERDMLRQENAELKRLLKERGTRRPRARRRPA